MPPKKRPLTDFTGQGHPTTPTKPPAKAKATNLFPNIEKEGKPAVTRKIVMLAGAKKGKVKKSAESAVDTKKAKPGRPRLEQSAKSASQGLSLKKNVQSSVVKQSAKSAKSKKNAKSAPAKPSFESRLTVLLAEMESQDNEEIIVIETPPQFFYPWDKLQPGSRVAATAKATQEAVCGILDDHHLRCTVPFDNMAKICKRLKKRLDGRRLENIKGMNTPALESTFDEAFNELSERDVTMNKSIFRQELLKYILIARSHIDKLSTVTMLSVVEDLKRFGAIMTEHEVGCPPRVASTVEQFYDITVHEFANLSEQEQLRMHKAYIKERLKWCKDFAAYLHVKYRKLIDETLAATKKGADKRNPFKGSKEGSAKEDELIESFMKNRNIERSLFIEYERLTSKEEVTLGPYQAKYRQKKFRGVFGPKTEAEEEQFDRDLANLPFDLLKEYVDGDNAKNDNLDVKYLEQHPGMTSTEVRYKHTFIPTPAIHLVHENL